MITPDDIFMSERHYIRFEEDDGNILLEFECDDEHSIYDVATWEDNAIYEILMAHEKLWSNKHIDEVVPWVEKLLSVYSLDKNYDTANAWFNTYIALEGLK